MTRYQPEPEETPEPDGPVLWEICFAGFLIGVMVVAAYKLWTGEQ